MEITRSARPAREMANVKLWHCGPCEVVHMSVKEMVLNFTREEFASFTDTVVDVHYNGWDRDRSVFDLTEHDAKVYANAVVH